MNKKKPDKMMCASNDEAVKSPTGAKSSTASTYQTPTKATSYKNDSSKTPRSNETNYATPSNRQTIDSAHSNPTSDKGRLSFSTPPTGGNSDCQRTSHTRVDAPSAARDSCENSCVNQELKGAGRSKLKAKVKGLFSKKSSKTLYADARNATTTAELPPLPAQEFSRHVYQNDWQLSPQQGRTSCYYRPGPDAYEAAGRAQRQLFSDTVRRQAATHLRLLSSLNRAYRPTELDLGPKRRSNWNILRKSGSLSEWLFIEKPTVHARTNKLPLLHPEQCRIPMTPRYKFERPPHTARALRSMLTYQYNHDLDKHEPVWKISSDSQIGLIRKVALRKLAIVGFPLDHHLVHVDFGYDDPWGRMFVVKATHVDDHTRYQWMIYCCLPKFPKYKLRSVVATMMYVKEHTNLPVSKVIAYEFDTDNLLGMEFIMVEMPAGQQYSSAEKMLSLDAKRTFARCVADIIDQLSRLTFSDIGNLHRDFEAPEDVRSSFVDICTEANFIKEMRIDYAVPRGPFKSLYEFYSAQIATLKHEAQDPRQAERLKWWFPSQADPKRKTQDDRTLRELIHQKHKSRNADEDGPWDFMPPPNYTYDDMQLLPAFCDAFQNILHLLTSPHELPLGATRLAHFNLRKENIMVNAAGQITGLLDWDYIWIAPLELIKKYPSCIPNLNEEEDEDGASADRWAEMQLAMEYEDRLRELSSPHLDVWRHQRNPLLFKLERFLRRVPSMEDFMRFLDEIEESRQAEEEGEEKTVL